jgi:hypothetical protein
MPNGKEEMLRCEQVFRQICWLEERFWPDVDGMGEEDETSRYDDGFGGNAMQSVGVNGGSGTAGSTENGGQAFGGALNGIGEPAGSATGV